MSRHQCPERLGVALDLWGPRSVSLILPLAQGRPGCPGPEALLLPPYAAGTRGPD